ncbi:hypothetical protein FSP39_000380 [Pinctada imbricata]|uniref:Uncharacterized protein n=1 Tax=Pinctada imbricata TaxID=66713 RepID=A0AA88Y0T2_PINIB|nr:hypothetical protein FSP39_000380 [Pinctada imbricata]
MGFLTVRKVRLVGYAVFWVIIIIILTFTKAPRNHEIDNSTLRNKFNKNTTNRYLIYTCRKTCAGFANRIRGIITVFLLAKRTNRIFGISEESKCGLTTFLKPASYDWRINAEDLKGLSSVYHDTIIMEKTGTGDYYKNRNDFVQNLEEDVVFLQTNQKPHISNYSETIKGIFEELFVFDPDIVHELKAFKETSMENDKTVCAHIRVGSNPGFSDIHSNNIGSISAIWEFLSQYDIDGYVIYVASDSNDVRESAKRRFPKRFIDLTGPVIHIDESEDDSVCSGFRKATMDFLFLSQCNVLLLTYSSFGSTASILRGNKDHQYCFQNGQVLPCTEYNLKWQRTSQNELPLDDV